MAIRFGSSDPKIWLRFCSHLTTMIIRYMQKPVFDLVFNPFQMDLPMHKYAFSVYLCSIRELT